MVVLDHKENNDMKLKFVRLIPNKANKVITLFGGNDDICRPVKFSFRLGDLIVIILSKGKDKNEKSNKKRTGSN